MINPDKGPQIPADPSNPTDESVNLMEAQLQQELRGMFEVDTQKGLQTYLDLAVRLQPQTWRDDIQTLYRTIHTIKGGAVTVGADGILTVATELENVLSDLRHLETAPPLEDGNLTEMLVEAGELLAAAIPMSIQGDQAYAQVKPAVQRLQQMHNQLRQQYLPQWSEQMLLQQEFARQGLDLVVLDLEITIENLPTQGTPTEAAVQTARSTLDQLYKIGQELQFAAGWGTLLRQAEMLLAELSLSVWRSQWPRLFQALRDCAHRAGESVPFELDLTHTPFAEDESPAPFLAGAEEDAVDLTPEMGLISGMQDFLVNLDAVPPVQTGADWPIADAPVWEETPAEADSQAAQPLTEATAWLLEPSEPLVNEQQSPSLNLPNSDASAGRKTVSSQSWGPAASQMGSSRQDMVQIPVPLETLDQSAQDLISTLMSVRNAQGIYQTLQAQVLQLVALAQEGVQHITRLRQIQEDYALIDNLKIEVQDGSRPTLERYRQGYTTINRLLETSLRLSELGAEAEKSTKQMTDSLQFLDSRVMKLQDTVEASRLVPFSNLAFRARAILRDLTTRFQKSARLLVHGESIELDVGTARSLEPALLHLIRNAFDHALESVAERHHGGKPEQGTLTLSLQRQGSSYRLDVSDDGRGIDSASVQARAEALGLPLTQVNTSADLLAVICQPGFSSETQVSELSGRGVGMDVVVNQINKLGGRLTLETEVGRGSTFHLQFPVPHLLVSCVLMQAGNRTFAIPTEDIRTTALFESLQVSPVKDLDAIHSWEVEMDTETVPGLDLLEYWQPQGMLRDLDNTAICTCIQSGLGDRYIWLMTDDLLGQVDLIITPLPAPLHPPEGLMGMSLQSDGSLVPVLNATALVERLHTAPNLIAAAGLTDSINQEETWIGTATILIVDDAALMRRRLESSLMAYGHTTHTCADGLEAWNWLQTNPPPALIITDIEMPNLDGFTFIDRCRQERMKFPILVVSSRLSEDWFEEAQRVGATDYLTKGFSTLELISKVSELLAQ